MNRPILRSAVSFLKEQVHHNFSGERDSPSVYGGHILFRARLQALSPPF